MTDVHTRNVSLADRYELDNGEVLLTGLQALVRIPLEQHRLDRALGLRTATLISGYEGSPLAGYDLEIQRRQALMDAAEVVFRPAVNEELGANAVQGSQLASASDDKAYDGVVGIWYGKAPGLDRATDALRHGNLGGADRHGGVLVLVGDDSTAKSSTVPSSSEAALVEIGMPVLSPSDPQDVLELGLHGVALSRFCGLWTALKLATNVVDGAATVRVHPQQIQTIYPSNEIDGAEFVHSVTAHFLQPTLDELEESMTRQRVELARRYALANNLNPTVGDPDARVGIIAAGATYRDVREAMVLLGLPDESIDSSGVRVLKLGMVSPLVPSTVEDFAAGLDELIIVEEKRPVIESAVKDILYGRPGSPQISGRRTPNGANMFRSTSDLPPRLIAKHLAARFAEHLELESVADWLTKEDARLLRRPLPMAVAPSRTPYFCSGCPHNSSTEVPEGSLVGAGIGCSALAALMPPARVGEVIGFTQMGGEGASWVGMAPFVKRPHLIQNIGDGTFHHSGSLAVRGAIAANANITYKLLYNSAVAMTGGQQAIGKLSIPELTRSLKAEGVKRIVITTEDPKRYRKMDLPHDIAVRPRSELLAAQEQLSRVPGVTVLIHDQECATELRRKRKRNKVADPATRVLINERVCEGCGDCGVKSNCLSVQPVDTEFGRKTRIHQASCNKDYSCLDGDCPSFIKVTPGDARRQPQRHTEIDVSQLPAPRICVPTEAFNMRITGVGGTGVVTAAQVIATAAMISGMYVRTLDQLGMAQKGGAVVSDVRLSLHDTTGGNKVTPEDCDLYLGCDLLVAAETTNLAVLSPDRSVGIISTTKVPTGSMVTDTSVSYPPVHTVLDAVMEHTRREHSVAVDAREAALTILGDDQFANIFLIGVAVQAGALPIEPHLLEQALELNGVAVEKNIQAFRSGRYHVVDPAWIQTLKEQSHSAVQPVPPELSAIAARVAVDPSSPLGSLVSTRVVELARYQDADYAATYADAVEQVRQIETRTLESTQLITLAFARNLFKLMAFKDEYEVARLSLDPDLDRRIKDEFGPDARYAYQLHPPVLRALGMKRKISLGQWFRPIFALLYAMRHLRGTPFDLFGYGTVRRTERSLPEEYRLAMEQALSHLTPETAPTLLQLAELPDLIRGYDHIKMDNVDKYRRSASETLAQLRNTIVE